MNFESDYRLPKPDVDRIMIELEDEAAFVDALTWEQLRRFAKNKLVRVDRGVESIHIVAKSFERYFREKGERSPWGAQNLLDLLSDAHTEAWAEMDSAQHHVIALMESASTKLQHPQARSDKAKRPKEPPKSNAELTKEIALALDVTTRHARNLRDEGTSDPRKAQVLARILGTSPQQHLRRSRRRRSEKLAKRFDEFQIEDACFDLFVLDETTDAYFNPLVRSFRERWQQMGRWWNPKSLEEIVQQTRLLDIPPCSLEIVEEVWKSFQVWRIRTICRVAISEIHEGI